MRSIFVITAIAALSACSNDKSTTITTEDGKEVKVTADGGNSSESGTITFEGKDGAEGKITYGDAAAKQGLPLGLPVYPGGEVKGAFMGGAKGETGGMATVMTKDPADKVMEFYRVEVEKRGFTVEMKTTSSNNGASFTAKSADKGGLIVAASPGEGGMTAVSIIGGSKN